MLSKQTAKVAEGRGMKPRRIRRLPIEFSFRPLQLKVVAAIHIQSNECAGLQEIEARSKKLTLSYLRESQTDRRSLGYDLERLRR